MTSAPVKNMRDVREHSSPHNRGWGFARVAYQAKCAKALFASAMR